MRSSNAAAYRDVLQALLRLARPYKTRFAVIVTLAVLATGADLLQPLIYRTAINDVAGLFVGRPISRVPIDDQGGGQVFKYEHREKELEESGKTLEPHRPGFVAPRTGRQALTTLLEAVVLLFVIGVAGYFLSLAADYQSTVAGSRIEAQLIQSTFGHVLRLPLGFFSRRASGGLAKRIDQCDQVAPVVAAFTQQIVPEGLRIFGICVIMLTQSWKLALVALCVLPPYFWITRRAARRLETGMSEYYQMWENVSARIQDALSAIKTVKLSGAEKRETERLEGATQVAYDDYIGRSRTGNHYFLAGRKTNAAFGRDDAAVILDSFGDEEDRSAPSGLDLAVVHNACLRCRAVELPKRTAAKFDRRTLRRRSHQPRNAHH